LLSVLQDSGFKVESPQGAFYIMADFSDLFEGNDIEFAKFLISQIGVATIPPSSFFCDAHRHIGSKFVRFAFCKNPEVLDAASERLLKLKQRV
jgi:N-succinyldiaminopimelate aminotransferase